MLPRLRLRDRRDWTTAAWLSLVAIALLTAIVVLQQTPQALLPPRREAALWGWTTVALLAVLFLRAGLADGSHWRRAQLELGTISNSYYEPRRRALTDGGAVFGAIAGALWWGATTWTVLVTGLRHRMPARGLLWLETSLLVGILAGGLIGAVGGRVLGEVWERRHRQRRRRSAVHA
ncbi:MAG TPA: hypothetical protein VF159_12350 [Gemmatimonadaceae bacterium]